MARISLITGGSNFERNVALAGAALVTAALRSRGHEVVVIDTFGGPVLLEEEEALLDPARGVSPPTESELERIRRDERVEEMARLEEVRSADVVFPVLHGLQGEGGELQALLEMVGASYVGSDVLGSALAMDKEVCKRLLIEAGVATPAWLVWPATRAEVESLGLPLVVKPSRVGSTIGLSVVHRHRDLEAAVAVARRYDEEVLLESFVQGRELTVGVLGDEALAVGEIVPRHEVFDYECKYTPGMSEEIFPADIPDELTRRVRALALRVHRILKLRDFSRVDFMLDSEHRVWCLEANTLPGMTPTSLLPQSAAACGIPFDELCDRLCRLALERSRRSASSRDPRRLGRSST